MEAQLTWHRACGILDTVRETVSIVALTLRRGCMDDAVALLVGCCRIVLVRYRSRESIGHLDKQPAFFVSQECL